MRKQKAIYAIYKGEEYLTSGTAKELSKELEVSEKYVYWMTSPTCHKRDKGKRMIAVRIE